jgi:hypothetical protein
MPREAGELDARKRLSERAGTLGEQIRPCRTECVRSAVQAVDTPGRALYSQIDPL